MIFWIEKDSVQTETESLKRTSRPKSLSPLHPLRGAKIAAKERVIEVDPVVVAQSGKGDKICYKFRDGKCEKGKDCPYKHVKDSSRSGTPKKKGKGKGGSRSGSPNRKSKEEMAKIPCTYFQQGKCRRGDKCFYKHEVAAAPTKDPKRTNSPAPKKKASAKSCAMHYSKVCMHSKGKRVAESYKGHERTMP